LYFFSSRRRHTRFSRDWSSDVCSSDLASESIDFLRRRDPRKPFFLYASFNAPHPPFDPPAWAYDQYRDVEMPEQVFGDWVDDLRSEERRVGKERRSWWDENQ